MSLRRSQKIFIIGLILTIVFVGYSYIFRTYFDANEYLEIAYDYTGRDETIINWQEPDFEIINHKGRLSIHIIFYTTEDLDRGPIGLYIDPLKKAVVDEDPRGSSD